MVFVADRLPDELVRIIEFLNEQLTTAEVLGVAVPQFVGGDAQVLVPRVVGVTQTAAATKQQGGGSVWNEETFLEAARGRCTEPELAFLERLFEHGKSCGQRFNWGSGRSPGVSGWYTIDGTTTAVWTANAGSGGPASHAYLYLYAPDLQNRISAERFDRFIELLERIPAFEERIADARDAGFKGKYMSMYLYKFVDNPDDAAAFFDAINALMG